LLNIEHKRLREVLCDDKDTVKAGNDMFDWIEATLTDWDSDEKMVWKATALHHPMWGKTNPDFANIVTNFLPMLMDHKVDLYLNGHEHMIQYAHYPYSQVDPIQDIEDYLLAQMETDFHSEAALSDYECLAGQETFFGYPEQR